MSTEEALDAEKIVVYHDNCHDGITALWCAFQSKFWVGAQTYAAKYDEPPDLAALRDKHVLIVDFSWKRGPLSDVLDVCRTLTVLDHHKTAEEELRNFVGNIIAKYRCVFDMERSGAGLAWDELVGGPRPPLVNFVEDRDLWRFALPNSREVHAACSCYPLDLTNRVALMQRPIPELVLEGAAVLRYHDKLVGSAAKHALRETIAGHEVPSIACPTIEIVSDLGHRLAQGQPFACIWVDRPDGKRMCSLRSDDNGLDVSEIAKQFGGGGHKHAAGFTVEKRAQS